MLLLFCVSFLSRLCCMIFLFVSFMTVSPVVAVSRGEDAILNCSFTHKQKNYSGNITVKWLARDPKTQPFFQCSVKNDSVERGNDCSGSRLQYSLDGDPRRGQLSLLIRDVQLTDNGTFFLDHFGLTAEELLLNDPWVIHFHILYVVEMACGSDSITRSLRCDVEGHPLPKVVWLSVTRRRLDVQPQTSETGPYSLTTCIPYQQEEEVVSCRAESRLGEAERTYPTSNVLMISLAVCGIIALLLVLLSTGLIIYCLNNVLFLMFGRTRFQIGLFLHTILKSNT
uniref:Ig-like domain-containing protein n=1 Tax=Acanthochromis polyacanthus TaxID=80966 RepID=A0A3Q1EGY2_9TELE